MSTDFILPDIGEGIVECEVVEWLIQVGDKVSEDQPVADVMTDKALVQIPSMYSGVVDKLYYEKGDIAKVHAPLFSIVQDGDISTAAEPASAPAPAAAPAKAAKEHIEDFILPDIGEGIIECEVVEWLVSEGDIIKEDQPVCDVMTDKSPWCKFRPKYNGKVVRLYYDKGETAYVHKPLFAIEVIGSEGVASIEAASKLQPDEAPVTATVATAAAPAPQATGGEAAVPVAAAQGKAVASPAVRRLAREMGIDLSTIAGSGKKGRVYKEDLTAAKQAATAPAVQAPAAPATVPAAVPGTRVEKIRGIPLAMARAMSESASNHSSLHLL